MIDQIRPAAFAQWVNAQSGQTPLLLDVRESWEHGTASVRTLSQAAAFDVLYLPLREVPTRLTELPADRPIACLCHHGIRSQHVALYLQQRGFEQVINIQGGIDAWSAELDPQIPRY